MNVRSAFISSLQEALSEPTPIGDVVAKRFKSMNRGMDMGKGVNMVAKGSTALGYHPDVNSRKPKIIQQLTSFNDDRETGDKIPPGERVYLRLNQSNEIAQFYKFNIQDVPSEPQKLGNSKVMIKYDQKRRLFYLIRII